MKMDDISIVPHPKKILYIGYNYNSSYLMIGTDIGFQVHQTFPLTLKFSRILNGGIGLVKSLNKSNIFGLVGGGESPKYAPNKLLIWDDKQNKEIYEFRFNSFVSNCFIKLKYIFVFCKDTINILSMQTMKTVEIILTIDNPDGIGTISSNIDKYILSWPDISKGKIAIKDFSEIKSSSISINASEKSSSLKQILSFKAHESSIALLKLNNDGSKLATASQRGNMIRIFDTIKGCIIQELKRGTGDAKIYSLNFSYDNNFLGITSDHGTAHIFIINKNIKEVSNALMRSSLIYDEVNKKENNEEEKDKDKDKDNIDNNNIKDDENKKDGENKNDMDDFDIIDKEDIDDENENDKIDNKEEKDNKDKDDKGDKNIDNNQKLIDELTNSDVFEKNNNYQNQKSFLSKIMGFSNYFQSEFSFTSFKIPYKYQSFISFIPSDKNNNKIIVVDKYGNYTAAEINTEKETKIILKDSLI